MKSRFGRNLQRFVAKEMCEGSSRNADVAGLKRQK